MYLEGEAVHIDLAPSDYNNMATCDRDEYAIRHIQRTKGLYVRERTYIVKVFKAQVFQGYEIVNIDYKRAAHYE